MFLKILKTPKDLRVRRGRGRMVVGTGFPTTCAINAYHH